MPEHSTQVVSNMSWFNEWTAKFSDTSSHAHIHPPTPTLWHLDQMVDRCANLQVDSMFFFPSKNSEQLAEAFWRPLQAFSWITYQYVKHNETGKKKSCSETHWQELMSHAKQHIVSSTIPGTLVVIGWPRNCWQLAVKMEIMLLAGRNEPFVINVMEETSWLLVT